MIGTCIGSVAVALLLGPGTTPGVVPEDYAAQIEARRAEQDRSIREADVSPFTAVAVRMPRPGESVLVGVCDDAVQFDPEGECDPSIRLRYTGEGFRHVTPAGEEEVEGRLELGRFRLSLSPQGNRGRIQVHDPSAPAQAAFQALAWYPPNPMYRFEVEIEPYEEKRPVKIATTAGLVKTFQRYGRVRFELGGKPQALSVYLMEGSDPEEVRAFFIPFRDKTSGRETYGVGRYASLERDPEGRIILDFNGADNPNCAYNEFWNCPIPPQENSLAVSVRAGELPYPGAGEDH